MPELLTLEAAGAHLGVSRTTVKRWIANREGFPQLVPVQGSAKLLRRDEIDNYINKIKAA